MFCDHYPFTLFHRPHSSRCYIRHLDALPSRKKMNERVFFAEACNKDAFLPFCASFFDSVFQQFQQAIPIE